MTFQSSKVHNISMAYPEPTSSQESVHSSQPDPPPCISWKSSCDPNSTLVVDWTIPNFVDLDTVAEVPFNVDIDNETLRFKLSLAPKHLDKDRGVYISLFLHNLNDFDLMYSTVMSIISAVEEKRFLVRLDARLILPNDRWGWKKFRPRDDITGNAAKMLLPDGSLKVRCEVNGLRYNIVSEVSRAISGCWERMEFSDVILHCGGESFRCHKFMLASQSDVFRNMFRPGTKETTEGKAVLSEVKPDVLKQFLRFAYTGSTNDRSMRMFSQLLDLAKKYNVPRLTVHCEQRLMEVLSTKCMFDVAKIASRFNLDMLKMRVMEHLTKNAKQVTMMSGWKRFTQEDEFADLFCQIAEKAAQNLSV